MTRETIPFVAKGLVHRLVYTVTSFLLVKEEEEEEERERLHLQLR